MSNSTAAKKAPSATTARAKALGGKIAPRATALSGEEGAYLRKLKDKAERGVALTPAQRTDLRELEARRVARNAYTKMLRERGAAPKTAAPKTAQAPAPTAAKVQGSAMVLSKADMVGGLKAALLVVTDEQQKLGLQYALQLAQKLAD